MSKSCLVAAALLAAGLAVPADAASVTKTMPAGGSITLFGYTSVNPDCSPAPQPTLRLTGSPQNGSVSIKHGTTFAYFPPQNPRSACNTHRYPSLDVVYRPRPGFVGTDFLSVEAFYSEGVSRVDEYTINVK